MPKPNKEDGIVDDPQVTNPQEELEEIELPEDQPDPAAPRVVDLDEEDENEKLAKLDRESQNKAFAAMRKEAADARKERDDLQKKIKAYEEQQTAQPAPITYPNPQAGQQREYIGGVPVPQTKAEWDALARQDWQLAVDLRSTLRARELQEQARTVDAHSRVLEESKQKVLERHPELNDAGSDKSKTFLAILDKNPEYLKMAKGPIYAMRDMEEELMAKGMSPEQLFDSKKFNAKTEATRATRAALTSGGKMPEKERRTVQLSKDDLEFCTSQGIEPAEYAKQKLALETSRKGAQL